MENSQCTSLPENLAGQFIYYAIFRFSMYHLFALQAEFIRASHPNKKFAYAAEDVCIQGCKVVEEYVYY